MDELDRSIRRAKQLINRARLVNDLRAEAQGVSALRDFQTIKARYKQEAFAGNTLHDRLAAFLADEELQRAYFDWLIHAGETPEEGVRRLSRSN